MHTCLLSKVSHELSKHGIMLDGEYVKRYDVKQVNYVY
jgi:hypothetical protein